eukprot:GFUD01036088.1.p1 GENE.GFUD01036088.1~~GFUD01036088.1.p1  ORF type:complete len:287 (-),score=81.13 GFUD01036088.1:192-1052(-)
MSFSFNFKVESEETSKTVDQVKSREPENGITWSNAKEHFLQDFHLEKISCILSIEHFDVGCSTLNFVNSETVSQDLKARDYSGDLTPALSNSTDLVPGVYEGGLKIWECSEDLVNWLQQTKGDKLAGLKVLELGCGAGLPGIYCFKEGSSVWFSDYNEDVINEVTIPNTLLNVPSDPEETRFFSGDWGTFENNILVKEIKNDNDKFDLILTSETIYNVENQSKLISIFKNFTKKGGEVLVAAKSFYFGVGGGVKQFENLVRKSGLNVESVKKYEEGVTREILKITL